MSTPFTFAFFGGEPLAVPTLEKLKTAGLLPNLIVCNPDRPSGRGHKLTPPPVKVWAEREGIEVFQPPSYADDMTHKFLSKTKWDLFVVVAYNFILPSWLLKLPQKGVINVHPSLLPKLRGASPIRTAIKENLRDEIGVTIMLLDEQMDHGPILDQVQLPIADENWPMPGPELDRTLADRGGELLAEVLPAWMNDEIVPQEQDHEAATYCGRFTKEDHEVILDPQALPSGETAKMIWHKINAFSGIGETFFVHNKQRIKITRAKLTDDGYLCLLRVIPEGKKEVDFAGYLRSL